MVPAEKEIFAETAFKRLFWQGYKGRFGVFEWPTTHSFDGTWKHALNDPTNYDRGEWSAWRSGHALQKLLVHQNLKYPGQLYVLAHSMGNVVAGEALRLHSQAGGGQIVNTYVATQSAAVSHCYEGDINAPLQFLNYNHPSIPSGTLDFGPNTPNIYRNWFKFIGPAVGRRVNFYNPNDYALQDDTWEYNQIVKPDWSDSPDQLHDYNYNDLAGTFPIAEGFIRSLGSQTVRMNLGDRNDVRDRYEIMSFAAEARSQACGKLGIIPGFERFNIRDIWKGDDSPEELTERHGIYSAHKWHSAQFRSTNVRQLDYWKTLLGPPGFNIHEN